MENARYKVNIRSEGRRFPNEVRTAQDMRKKRTQVKLTLSFSSFTGDKLEPVPEICDLSWFGRVFPPPQAMQGRHINFEMFLSHLFAFRKRRGKMDGNIVCGIFCPDQISI